MHINTSLVSNVISKLIVPKINIKTIYFIRLMLLIVYFHTMNIII